MVGKDKKETSCSGHRLNLGLLAVLLCAACRDEPSDPGATDRPAAVDLFSAWPGDESFRIAAEPDLVVGSHGSLPLGMVSGAVFFGDGIAIADVHAHALLVLDAAGRLIYRQGREGEGPGEYAYLAGIARHGDGLVTSDAYHMRVTRLDASGRYIGQTKHSWYAYQMHGIVGAFGGPGTRPGKRRL